MRTVRCAVLLACLATVPQAGRAEEPRMAPTLAFPHAGLSAALPEGFEPVADGDPYLLVRAVRPAEGGQAGLAISLSAYPVGENVTTDNYADAMAEQLAQSLAVRDLKVLKRMPLPVAGVTGSAARMSYVFRGVETLAARVYFIRESKNGKPRVCYVLTVEAAPEQEKALLPTLAAVIQTVSFAGMQDPAELVPGALGPALADPKRGYSIRVPQGWFAALGPAGAALGQANYLRGAEPTVTLSVVTAEVPPDAAPGALCEANLEQARAEAAKRKLRVELVSAGEAKLAGRDARQFVLRQSQSAPSTQKAEPDPPVVIAQRTCCAAAAGGGARAYSLVLICQGADAAKAAAILDAVAAGFAILPLPETVPAPSED